MARKKNLNQDLKKAKNLGELKMTRSEAEMISEVESSNDAKASTFLDAINKYAEEQRDKLHSESEKRKQEELAKAENEILNDAYQLIQHELAKARKEITSKLSKEEIESKKELFKKRNEITNKVFEDVRNKLIAFTESEDYSKLLISYAKAASKILSEKNTVIYLRSKDMSYANKIKHEFPLMSGCIVTEADDILIGGIRAYNENMGLVVDETLDSKLADQHEWFQKNSGLRIE